MLVRPNDCAVILAAIFSYGPEPMTLSLSHGKKRPRFGIKTTSTMRIGRLGIMEKIPLLRIVFHMISLDIPSASPCRHAFRIKSTA